MTIPSIPLFIQVAETIKKRIITHEYGLGEAIPSAKKLENEFNVSNITIRRAMGVLTSDGYIISRRGTRAQVAERLNDVVEIEITGDFWNWIDTVAGKKLAIAAEVIDRQVIDCPDPIRAMLSLKSDEKVERIKRIRKWKDEPISFFVNYGPAKYLTQLTNRDIEKQTFIEAFQNVCQVKPESVEQKVQATTADMDLAAMLQVKFGFPLFFMQNIFFSENKIPMAVTHMYYRSDRYVYTIKRNL